MRKSKQANSKPTRPFPIVGVGASAGGLETYKEFLKALPGDTGMAFVLVQHLDPKHGSMLADLLVTGTAMPVAEVSNDTVVEPDHVYVIPSNTDLALLHGRLYLMPRHEEPGLRLPIDYFFRSLAHDRGDKAIGVVLSGTGSDGAKGLSLIKAEGGITFAQEPATAKYDGMPRAAIAAGAADFALSPKGIAEELSRIGRHPYPAHIPDTRIDTAGEGDSFRKIFILLRGATGVDFTYYKHNTIQRRIARRMVLHQTFTLEDYLQYLQLHPEETEALYHDILIIVTEFFRDPGTFDALKSTVFPRMVEGGSRKKPLRVWVPGCSTGEEAYSIAICLFEFLEGVGDKRPVHVFGTDISEKAVAKARRGFYPENVITGISSERLRRFFAPVEGGYQVTRMVRDACVFARHDVVRDPPFSKLDLVSCRNLLIYLGAVLQ